MRTDRPRRTPPAQNLVWFVAVLGCDPTYSLCVSVRSCQDDSPLAGVAVNMRHASDYDETLHTEPDGKACLATLDKDPPSPLDVRYEKPGYETLDVRLDRPRRTLPEVCLETAGCDAGAGGCPDAGP